MPIIMTFGLLRIWLDQDAGAAVMLSSMRFCLSAASTGEPSSWTMPSTLGSSCG